MHIDWGKVLPFLLTLVFVAMTLYSALSWANYSAMIHENKRNENATLKLVSARSWRADLFWLSLTLLVLDFFYIFSLF